MTIATINDILVARQLIDGANIIGFGLYGFIFFQSAAIAKIFARDFWELKSSKETIQKLNQELRIHIEDLDQMVDHKTREVRSIMTHIRQGICMVGGQSLQILEEYSQYFEEITGKTHLAGRKFIDLVFAGSDLTESQRKQVEQTLVNSLFQEAFAFDVNRHLLVKEFRRKKNVNADFEVFELDWHIIENEEGLVERYLIAIRNVSQLRQLQEEAIRNQEGWILIQELLQIPPQKLPDLMRNMKSLLDEMMDLVRSQPGLSNVDSVADNSKSKDQQIENEFLIFRLLHTMKVNAHSFGMNSLAALLHEVTSGAYSPDKEESLAIPTGLPNLFETIVRLSFEPLSHIVQEIIGSLRIKAQILDKEPPNLIVADAGILFEPAEHQFLFSIFTQLVRNSLAHGLETCAQRRAKGKSLQGNITIKITYDPDFDLVRMVYEDDGQGYHPTSLRRKGMLNGLITESETNQENILNLVFHPDLSTQEDATDLAGRGMGLDAVRYLLKKREGNIAIEATEELGVGYFHCRLLLSFKAKVWLPQQLDAAS